MATRADSPRQIADEQIEKLAAGCERVFVNEFTDGLLDQNPPNRR
jgi:hypothetical protein